MKSDNRIRIIIGLLLCSLIPASPLHAESSVWRLKTDPQNFYIAGSVHMLRKSDYPLPAEFETAYQQSDTIIFETFLDELQQPENQQRLLQTARYPKGTDLEKNLSPKTWAQLKKYCDTHQLPLENLRHLKPWMLVILLTITELQKNGIHPADGIDEYFNRKAKQDNKKTRGLVSVAEHIDILASLEHELNSSLIEIELTELKETVSAIKNIIPAWRNGEEEKLNTLLNTYLRRESPALYQRILLDRNQRWLGTIEKLIQSKENIMLVVGAAHLVGKGSVIEQLQQKGYLFEKLKLPANTPGNPAEPITSSAK